MWVYELENLLIDWVLEYVVTNSLDDVIVNERVPSLVIFKTVECLVIVLFAYIFLYFFEHKWFGCWLLGYVVCAYILLVQSLYWLDGGLGDTLFGGIYVLCVLTQSATPKESV